MKGLILALSVASQAVALPASSQSDSGSSTYSQPGPGRLIGDSFGLPGHNEEYDYVIAGAGLAGSIVAARLAEAFPDQTVAVVEPGRFYEYDNGNWSQVPYYSLQDVGANPNIFNPLNDWGLVSEPLPGAGGQRMHYAQGKAIGGSTARNQMIYHRSPASAYEMFADVVGDDDYLFENMLPHFQKTFTFTEPNPVNYPANQSHQNFTASSWAGSKGEVPVAFPNYLQPIGGYGPKAFDSVGFPAATDFNAGNLTGYGYHEFTIDPHTGTRTSTDLLIRKAIASTTLKVYSGSEVRNIIFDSNKKATGLNVTTAGIHPFTLSARKEVIISAGVWHSPQLLMVSGVGPKATLEEFGIPVVSDLEAVGQNVWDGTNIGGITYEANVPTAGNLLNEPAEFEAAVAQFYKNGSGPMVSESADFWAWEKLPTELRNTWPNETTELFNQFPAGWPEIEYQLIGGGGNLIAVNTTKNLITVGLIMVATNGRGNMTIKSADSLVPPVINPAWFTDERDHPVAVSAYHRARQIMKGIQAQGVLIGDEVFPGANVTSDADIINYIQTQGVKPIHHATATCAMGKVGNPATVVDSKARVIGVSNLRVIDSSSLPFTPAGHTQGTTYAHAEKLVSDIIKQYSS